MGIRSSSGLACLVAVGLWLPSEVGALPSIPGVLIHNPEWGIIMTPEGYSDVALDLRSGFSGREYLSGEWAASVFYSGGSNPADPIWLRSVWGFPCWTTNSNFTVDDEIKVDSPSSNGDGFTRYFSRINNGDVEITIRYEMDDTGTGVEQGDERAGTGGLGSSTTSGRYVLIQTYEVKNISGGSLTNVRFYHFLHGLKSGISLYDDRNYGGAFSGFQYDNTQKGTSLSLNSNTNEIFSHADTVCMQAEDMPSAIECGYYGIDGIDDHVTGKPSTGVHLSIEADSLDGTDFFDPPEGRWVSGGMCFNFPNLADDETHTIRIMMSILTVSTFSAPPPNIELLDARRSGSNFIIDFKETTGAPLDGFLLRSSKTMTGTFPDDWPQVAVPLNINVPNPGENRYVIPIDLMANPKCFFRIQPFFE